MRHRGTGRCIAAVLVLLAGCSDDGSGPADDAPTSTSAQPLDGAEPGSGFPADWSPDPVEWRACAEGSPVDCASLTVPLDWSQPDGDQIELALARRRAPATGDRVGSLVVNPGGPGASGVDFLDPSPFSERTTSRFDLVSWDPRGGGESTPVVCGPAAAIPPLVDPDPDDDTERKVLEDAGAAVAHACTEDPATLGRLPHLGSDDTARDLEAIRRLLDDGPLNFYGFSYGTVIGQRYRSLFPGRLRSMVLDGVVPSTADLATVLEAVAESTESAVTRLLASCVPAARCPLTDAAGSYDRLARQVDLSPLPTSDPSRTVGPAELAAATVASTYDPRAWRELLAAIGMAEAGAGDALWNLAQSYYDFGDWASYFAISCVDRPHPADAATHADLVARLRSRAPRVGGFIGSELSACASWPVPVATAAADGFDDTDVLVLGNTGDAAAPYVDSEALADRDGRSHLLTLRSEGHTSYGRDRCIDGAVDAYLADLELPARGASCPI